MLEHTDEEMSMGLKKEEAKGNRKKQRTKCYM